MARCNLIKIAKVLIEDMYEAMEYLKRNLNTMSFNEMHEMVTMIDGISVMLKQYVTEETKASANTALVNWSQLKIKTLHTLMNSRVVLV